MDVAVPILVTGGAGFIGSHLTDELTTRGAEVIVVDNFSSGKKEWLSSGASLVDCDVNKTDQLTQILLKYKPKIIYHLVGHTQLRNAILHPQHDAEQNIGGVLSLIQACITAQEHGYTPNHIIFSSSSAVYGGCRSTPFSERTLPKPTNPYGIAKRSAEQYLEWYGQQANVLVTSLRYANVYGPRQSTFGEAGVIAKFMEAIVQGETLNVYGDGEHCRDYIFVKDVVAANVAVAEHTADGIFVVGTGVPTSTQQLAQYCQQLTSQQVLVRHLPLSFPEQPESVLDSTVLHLKTRWLPTVPLIEGLTETLQWYSSYAS